MTGVTRGDIIDFAMATEIRPVTEDEHDRAHFILAYSFNGDRSQEGRERLKHVEEMGITTGLYEDGEMAACLRVFPLRTFIHGTSIPLGGVSSVACLPEHRRKGYVGQLLRHALTEMRERGQTLSSLWTPHPSLYRRYGWMVASGAFRYRFKPKEIQPLDGARPEGRAQRITDEQWPAIAEVYDRFAPPRNGYLDRDERWWKEALFRHLYDDKRRPNDVAMWTDREGRSSGYIVYSNTREDRPDGPDVSKLIVDEFVATDSAAFNGLLRYLLSHDLADEVSWWGPADEPLDLAVDEPHRVKREHWHGFMLRIVDVEQAIAARPPAAGAPEGAFSVHIADAAAPWNQGVWRIECAGGRITAKKTNGAADLSTDAAAFAAMYNAYLRPSDAARSGLAEAADTAAVLLADRILAADYPPHASDFF